jgi:NADPH-dependent curcumin reductase CurA
MRVLLARRPVGWVQPDDFAIVQAPIPQPRDGEFLIRTHYLSLDPYMRGRMNDVKSYAPSVEIGEVMVGATVGEVVESRHSSFKPGDMVLAQLGWQQYGLSDGKGVNKINPRISPSAYLGVLGMPGVTAWVGLLEIGKPRRGETVVVSAAAGAVGGVVGQLARQQGCRAIGIAGGPAKCAYVRDELKFDACVDYKAGSLAADLQAAAPNGIDIYFDNVGGQILNTVVPLLNAFARIPLCGLISQYNTTEPEGLRDLGSLLGKRVRLQGFIVSDYLDRWLQALNELSRAVASGALTYRETVTEGLERAPEAFIGMLRGENIGKQIVKLI